jgi:hypothetical protein
MGLAALAVLAANLFLFHFSTGVALGGSRTSPGITLGVPDANSPLDPEGAPDAPWPCDVSLEVVDNLASFSSSWSSCQLFSGDLRVGNWLFSRGSKCFWRRVGGWLITAQVSLIVNNKSTIYQVINLAFLQISYRKGNSWCHLHICVQGLR